MTRITEGGMRMPSVPPAASVPVDERGRIAVLACSSGSAIWPMVAAVASDEPQIAPKPAQPPIGGHRDAAAPVAEPGARRR